MTKEDKAKLAKEISEKSAMIDRLTKQKILHDKESDKLRKIIKKELDKLEALTAKRWPNKPFKTEEYSV